MCSVITRVLFVCLLTSIISLSPAALAAEKAAPAEASAKEKRPNHPFRGKLSAVDKSAMTISLEGKEKPRTIRITAQTRIAKAGKPATLADAIIGDEVAGQVVKTAEGHEEALSLRLGAKPEPEPKAKKETKETKKSEKQDAK